jgi:hypothetical protein
MWSSNQREGDRYRAIQYQERPVEAKIVWKLVKYEIIRP